MEKIKRSMPDDAFKWFREMLNDNGYVKTAFSDLSDRVSQYVHSDSGVYRPITNTVEYRFNPIIENRNEMFATFTHECGHAFDALAAEEYGLTFGELTAIENGNMNIATYLGKKACYSDEYLKALELDTSIMETSVLEDGSVLQKMIADDRTKGLQDFADGLFGTQDKGVLAWGHGDRYYNRKYNNIRKNDWHKSLQGIYKDLGYDASNLTKTKALARRYDTASELWANQFSALATGGIPLEYMEKYAPNTLEVLKKALKNRRRK